MVKHKSPGQSIQHASGMRHHPLGLRALRSKHMRPCPLQKLLEDLHQKDQHRNVSCMSDNLACDFPDTEGN